MVLRPGNRQTDDHRRGSLLPGWPAVGDRHTLNCRGQRICRASRLDGPARRRDPFVNYKAIVRIKSNRKRAARRIPRTRIDNSRSQRAETRRIPKLNRVDVVADYVAGTCVVCLNPILPVGCIGAVRILSDDSYGWSGWNQGCIERFLRAVNACDGCGRHCRSRFAVAHKRRASRSHIGL